MPKLLMISGRYYSRNGGKDKKIPEQFSAPGALIQGQIFAVLSENILENIL